MFCALFASAAIAQQAPAQQAPAKTEKKANTKVVATTYECPMKCEKSATAGKCSKCGMALVEVKAAKKKKS